MNRNLLNNYELVKAAGYKSDKELNELLRELGLKRNELAGARESLKVERERRTALQLARYESRRIEGLCLQARLYRHKQNLNDAAATCASKVLKNAWPDLKIEIRIGALAADIGEDVSWPYSKSYGYPKITKFPILSAPREFWQKLEIINGVPTAMGDFCSATWIEKRRGYTFEFVRGYLIDGVHVPESEAQTYADAQMIADREIVKQDAAAAKKIIKLEKLKRIWVSREDSRAAGNCFAGTEAFLERIKMQNVGALRADFVLQVAEQSSADIAAKAKNAIKLACERYASA